MITLTKSQDKKMKEHSKHYTKKHMIMMAKLMGKGKTFTESHNQAMKKANK